VSMGGRSSHNDLVEVMAARTRRERRHTRGTGGTLLGRTRACAPPAGGVPILRVFPSAG
jgi:hypothetical protein